MRETVTISLPTPVRKKIDQLAKLDAINRSDVIKDALKHYLAVREFRQLHQSLSAIANKKKIFTDEQVFAKIS